MCEIIRDLKGGCGKGYPKKSEATERAEEEEEQLKESIKGNDLVEVSVAEVYVRRKRSSRWRLLSWWW